MAAVACELHTISKSPPHCAHAGCSAAEADDARIAHAGPAAPVCNLISCVINLILHVLQRSSSALRTSRPRPPPHCAHARGSADGGADDLGSPRRWQDLFVILFLVFFILFCKSCSALQAHSAPPVLGRRRTAPTPGAVPMVGPTTWAARALGSTGL